MTHNDTKLNNVLLDDVTAEGVCVIDLDTTMPGSALYDFGDMVRTAVPKLAEDSTDLTSMDLKIDMFEALLSGYTQTATFLNGAEKTTSLMPENCSRSSAASVSSPITCKEMYFKIKRPSQNIDRCRNQFAFVQALERRMPELEDLVANKLASPSHS